MNEQQLSYRDYLASEHWKLFSKKIRTERGNKCEICGISGEDTPLNVHHLAYNHLGLPGEENDVILLCAKHHGNCHGAQIIIFSQDVNLYDHWANNEPDVLLKDLLRTRTQSVIFLHNRLILTKKKKGKILNDQRLDDDCYIITRMPWRPCDNATDLVF